MVRVYFKSGPNLKSGPSLPGPSLLGPSLLVLLNDRSVHNKVDLITQSNIDSNCSISAITETWLINDDSALASQLTPDGFKVLFANRSTQGWARSRSSIVDPDRDRDLDRDRRSFENDRRSTIVRK